MSAPVQTGMNRPAEESGAGESRARRVRQPHGSARAGSTFHEEPVPDSVGVTSGAIQSASDASAMGRLHALVNRLLACTEVRRALDEVLDAAISLTGAGMGLLQLLDAQRNVLTIATQRGFSQEFIERFREIKLADTLACARAA